MTEYTSRLTTETEKKRPNYFAIFGLLAVLTLIEVTVAAGQPVLLVVLALAKVAMVAMYYMHLRFETGWFTAIFLVPIPFVLMITVAIIVGLVPGPDGAAAAGYVCSFW